MTNMDNLTKTEYEDIIIALLKDISTNPEVRRIMTTKMSMCRACLAVHKRLLEKPNVHSTD
jgi:hypothetical protein